MLSILDSPYANYLIRQFVLTAVTKIAAAVARIGSEEWPVRLSDTTTAMVAEVARFLGVDPVATGPDEVALATGSAARFIHAALHTTTNPTVLSAGYKHNVIPQSASASLDCRFLPGHEEEMLSIISELAGEHVEVEVVHKDIALEAPYDAPLVEKMKQALLKEDPGAAILPYCLSGGTDNKALAALGIDGYGFAPLRLPADLDFTGMFHGVDERVPLDALVFGQRVLTDLLRTY